MHAMHKESNKVHKYTYYMPIYARLSNYISHVHMAHILQIHEQYGCTNISSCMQYNREQIFDQRSVWPETQSITFDIVSRCFENKSNNCCEQKFVKINVICLFLTKQIHNLAALLPGWPSRRVARSGFVL